MNIYVVTQNKVTGYDTCKSFVVVAPDEETARNTHPTQHPELEDWVAYDDDYNPVPWESKIWVKSPRDVTVTPLGVAFAGVAPGIILFDFKES